MKKKERDGEAKEKRVLHVLSFATRNENEEKERREKNESHCRFVFYDP